MSIGKLLLTTIVFGLTLIVENCHAYKPIYTGDARVGVPTIIIHGLNDNCTENSDLVVNLSEKLGGTYVKCIEIGDGKRTTWWTNLVT
jgi:hypothetical protein